jgi:shikimate 5-dehydrogenase
MPIKCPACQREYDASRFGSGPEIVCACGAKLGLGSEEVLSQLARICRQYDLQIEEDKLAEIKNAQDRIVSLIINTDYSAVDIEIEKAKFRELIQSLFPDKTHLIDLIYEPRFKRLWEQFRGE